MVTLSPALAVEESPWTGICVEAWPQSVFAFTILPHPDSRTTGGQECVRKDTPGARLPVVGNGLDQVTVRGTHANPERRITGRAARSFGQDKGGGRFTDEGV